MESDGLPSLAELNAIALGDTVSERRGSYDSSDHPKIQGFKGLVVWQESMDFVAECYRVTTEFPKIETYGLTRQLRDAAVSITLNVAEGWGRNGAPEFARFCGIARASLQEVDAAFEIAIRLDYLSTSSHKPITDRINRLSAMLLRLIKTLKS